MTQRAFDEFATTYDHWFLQNPNVLESEVLLVRHCLGTPGRTLSVGCGTGLFESILRLRYGVEVDTGLEPTEGAAQIARKRHMEVTIGTAESMPWPDASFDTVMFNGSPSYIPDLARAFAEAWRVLRPGGRLVVLDVPRESSYGLLYNLAKAHKTWDHPDLQGAKPPQVYPLVFVAEANWRTTDEKLELLTAAGFQDPSTFQTLTRHPRYSDESVEEPIPGCDRGDYVGIVAHKR